MSSPEEIEEIKRYMQSTFPKYVDNLEMGKELYEKLKMKREFQRPTATVAASTHKDIATLKLWDRAIVRGVVMEVSRAPYIGCSECKKKASEIMKKGDGVEVKDELIQYCPDARHSNVPLIEFIKLNGVLRDNSGAMDFIMFAKSSDKLIPQVELGDEVEMDATVRPRQRDRSGDEVQLSGNTIKIVESIRIKDLLDLVTRSVKMTDGSLNLFLEEKGLTKQDVEPYIKKEAEYWMIK